MFFDKALFIALCRVKIIRGILFTFIHLLQIIQIIPILFVLNKIELEM